MPLILSSQRLIRPNPLAYPAGAVPLVDPLHPMSQKLALSAIASNGTVISLLNGVVGTPVNSPGFATASTLGPSVRILTADSNAHITLPWAFSGSASNGYTQAAIFSVASAEAANYMFSDRDISGGFNCMVLRDFPNNLAIESQANTQDTGCSVNATSGPFGVPYFAAWSAFPNNTASIVVKNLLTGQVQSNTISLSAATSFSTSGTASIGGRSSDASRCYNGNIAAVALSGQALSLAQLLQWAQSPWEFWYPRSTIQYTTPAATTIGGARIRQRFNRSPLAYPVGATPGVDRSHPAARNCLLSAIASTSLNFRNLLNGVPGTPVLNTGAAVPAMPSFFGPSILFPNPSNFDVIEFAGTTTGTNGFTVAVLACLQQSNGGNSCYIFSPDGGGNNAVGVALGSSDNLTINLPSAFDTGLSLNPGGSYNTPFFIALSVTAGGSVTAVTVNLRLGKVSVLPLTSSGGTPSAGDGTFYVGSRNAARQWPGWIAAISYSNMVLSTQQLLQWAADPWSFWYPNNFKEFATAGITPPPPTIVPARTMMGVGV